jgi:hypothetical protein
MASARGRESFAQRRQRLSSGKAKLVVCRVVCVRLGDAARLVVLCLCVLVCVCAGLLFFFLSSLYALLPACAARLSSARPRLTIINNNDNNNNNNNNNKHTKTTHNWVANSLEDVWAGLFVTKAHWPALRSFLATLKASELEAAKFRKLIGYALQALQASNGLAPATQSALAADETRAAIFSGLRTLYAEAVRVKCTPTRFAHDIHTMGVGNAAYRKDMAAAFAARCAELETAALQQAQTLPSIAKLAWRTDVTISTALLSRVFRPSITMQMTLSDGRIKTFECSVQQFQKLRYQIAKTLKAVQDLKRHPTILRELVEKKK